MRDIKLVLKKREQKLSQNSISKSLRMDKNNVKRIFDAAFEKSLSWAEAEKMSEMELNVFLFGKEEIQSILEKPDFDYIHRELLKPGTTLKLLWEEYARNCKDSKIPFYHYSFFCEQYRNHVKKNKLTMHIKHKPGDKMQVDWFGTTMEVTDAYTGEKYKAYLFEATLPFSMYCYVQACPSMDMQNWIDCHVNAYSFFGGTTRLLIPDNLKTGVVSHKKYEDPVLTRSYQEMADHYDTTILPARVKSPRDKGAVEGSVGVCTNAIIGHLRNRTFFSFEDLNKAIRIELDKFNKNPFQKREGSRESVYMDEEKEFMNKLPANEYELSQWSKHKVFPNYHVEAEKGFYYSVPYEYVGKYMEVKITKSTVTIYYRSTQICTHKRLLKKSDNYSTIPSHLPKNHQLYQMSKEDFLNWARNIGPNTLNLFDKKFQKYREEEQGYKFCLSVMKLKDKYSETRIEDACQLALEHISNPGYTNLKRILESGQDMKHIEKSKNEGESTEHAFLRGASYYGGKK